MKKHLQSAQRSTRNNSTTYLIIFPD